MNIIVFGGQYPMFKKSTTFEKLSQNLFSLVDNSSLAFIRISFGLLMFWQIIKYFIKGWIAEFYIKPEFLFKYIGFEWVQPLAGNGMYVHFAIMGILALFITMGLFYRQSIILFLLGFVYIFLLAQSRYLNHFYLIIIILFLMAFIPANRSFSLDALRKKSLSFNTSPNWGIWVLRTQIGIVYIYSGIAKINPDWLIGQPMLTFMAGKTNYPLIGNLLAKEWFVLFMSFSVLLLLLSVIPLLMYKRTRIFAFIVITGFHMLNYWFFNIGVFPLMMIVMTTIFFEPNWPRKIFKFLILPEKKSQDKKQLSEKNKHIFWTILIVAFLIFQILFPLRHFVYPGNHSFTGEGHRFAWQMLNRASGGVAEFYAFDPLTKEIFPINTNYYLSPIQYRWMVISPDMVLQFSHYISQKIKKETNRDMQVYSLTMVSLNGRSKQISIDPNVDLASQKRSLRHANWIYDLKDPRLMSCIFFKIPNSVLSCSDTSLLFK